VETFWQDLKYGLRMLRRSPVFTFIALLSLALGIGANTAIFTMINAIMLKALPVNNPDQLALFTIRDSSRPLLSFSYPLYERFRNDKKVFEDVVATGGANRLHMTVADEGQNGQSDLVQAEKVTGNYFNMLGVNPVLGRVLTSDDDRANNPSTVAVVSYNFWKRRFGSNPDVIGKAIVLNDIPFSIVGVAPPAFTGVELGASPDIWYPLWTVTQFSSGYSSGLMSNTTSWWLRVIGRLKPGVTVQQAQTEMDGIFQQMLTDIAGPRQAKWTPTERRKFFSQRLELQRVGPGFSYSRAQYLKALWILMTVVGLVLLIACANVANLLLVRAAARQKEIAVRLSIGAGRFRLIRQLLTESILLAVLGGALGLMFSQWAVRLLLTYVSDNRNVISIDLKPDPRVLGFTIAVSLLTGIFFGLAPAIRMTRLDLVTSLKDSSSNVRIGGSRIALDKLLVVTQVALSLFLLIGAGLFVRSLENLRNIDTGFDIRNVLLFSVDVKPGYKPEQRADLARKILMGLDALPGARSASLSSFSLHSGNGWSSKISVPGYTPQIDENMECRTLAVGPRFFETMAIPVLMGRDFDWKDDSIPVTDIQNKAIPVVINQTFARTFFKDEEPIGKTFTTGQKNEVTLEVVGVATDAKYDNLREKIEPAFYIPYFLTFNHPSFKSYAGTYQLRTVVDPLVAAATVQRTVKEIDRDAQLLDVRTMENLVDQSLVMERFIAHLSSFFSLFALLLASIGLYGIMSYSVVRRTKEMGIRIALGAQAKGVVWLVLRQSLLLTAIGVLIGVPAALGAARFVSSYMFGLSTADPFTIIAAVLVLLTVITLASYLPARRASRIDPMLALRYE